jgi:hypothetical protein
MRTDKKLIEQTNEKSKALYEIIVNLEPNTLCRSNTLETIKELINKGADITHQRSYRRDFGDPPDTIRLRTTLSCAIVVGDPLLFDILKYTRSFYKYRACKIMYVVDESRCPVLYVYGDLACFQKAYVQTRPAEEETTNLNLEDTSLTHQKIDENIAARKEVESIYKSTHDIFKKTSLWTKLFCTKYTIMKTIFECLLREGSLVEKTKIFEILENVHKTPRSNAEELEKLRRPVLWYLSKHKSTPNTEKAPYHRGWTSDISYPSNI